MDKISILLIEDQKLLLDTVRSALNSDSSFKVDYCLDDIALAIEVLRKKPNIDILFSDICTANDHNTLDYIKDIKKEFPNLKIILVTAFHDISFIKKAKKLKVDAFVYKNIPVEDLVSIIRNVYRGYSNFPSSESDNAGIFKDLNERELEVLRLYCSGLDRKEIADELFLSDSTIKNYISEILLKTSFDSMAKLALYAVKNGFII